jgi:hypothetical protein
LGEGRSAFPFEVWYKTRPLNPISNFILNRYLEISNTKLLRMSFQGRLEILDEAFSRFAFVSSLNSCNDFLARLSGELGVSPVFNRENVTDKKFATEEMLSNSLRQQIIEENQLDVALFDKYQNRGWSPQQIGYTHGKLEDGRWASLMRDISRPQHYIKARYLRDYSRLF